MSKYKLQVVIKSKINIIKDLVYIFNLKPRKDGFSQ